ncbi:MAG: SPASM domain-containing protein [Candidatus Helarchaeota archaeon]
MLELRSGICNFKFENEQILITPELTHVIIPKDFKFPLNNIESIDKTFKNKLIKQKILVNPRVNKIKPKYQIINIIDHITFKDIDIDMVDYIFDQFIKNCCISPTIIIDCNYKPAAKLIELISKKYNENSINPTLSIFIRDSVEGYHELISKYLMSHESIELNNLFFVFHNSIVNEEYLLKFGKFNPLGISIFYDEIPNSVIELKDLLWEFKKPILLEITNDIINLDLENANQFELFINDDSINRLIYAFKMKKYFSQEFIKNRIIQPYCTACNTRILIAGGGDIYSCNTGYRFGNKICDLKNQALKQILSSNKFKTIRESIIRNSMEFQKNSCLFNFLSGCIYCDKFNKMDIMKRILISYIK